MNNHFHFRASVVLFILLCLGFSLAFIIEFNFVVFFLLFRFRVCLLFFIVLSSPESFSRVFYFSICNLCFAFPSFLPCSGGCSYPVQLILFPENVLLYWHVIQLGERSQPFVWAALHVQDFFLKDLGADWRLRWSATLTIQRAAVRCIDNGWRTVTWPVIISEYLSYPQISRLSGFHSDDIQLHYWILCHY